MPSLAVPRGHKLGSAWVGHQYAGKRLKYMARKVTIRDADVRKQFGPMNRSERHVEGGQGFVDFSVVRSGRDEGKVRAWLS